MNRCQRMKKKLICPAQKPKNTVVSVNQLLGSGLTRERLESESLLEEKERTSSLTLRKSVVSKKKKKQEQECVTPGSVPKSKKKILKSKLPSSKKDTQTQVLSKTSGRVSTTIEKGYNVSLKTLHKELSSRLWLPTKTDCVVTVLSSLTSSLQSTTRDAWFSVKKVNLKTEKSSLETSTTCVTSLLQNTKEVKSPSTEDLEKPMRAFKYRVHLSKEHQKKVEHAFKVNLRIYNKCVKLCCRGDKTARVKANMKTLRNLLLNATSDDIVFSEEKHNDNLKVHYDIKDDAIREFVTRHKSEWKKVREARSKGRCHIFQMNFKDSSQCISLRKKSGTVKHGGYIAKWFSSRWRLQLLCNESFKQAHYEPAERGCNRFLYDTRLYKSNTGEYYLIVPYSPEIQTKEPSHIASLDPGEVIFQTVYGTDGNAYLIGEGDSKKLDSLALEADRMRHGIQRQWYYGNKVYVKAETTKTRWKLKRKARKIEEKIKNKITDIHRKTVKWLCDKYSHVIIPVFETQKMTKKEGRCIPKGTSRRLIRWSHYTFRTLLMAKSQVTGTKVHVGTEEYTSKTCTGCFFVNPVKGEREITCQGCGLEIHRDINGARNIMILNLKNL